MLLTEYNIQYVIKKAIKGSVVSYYIGYQPIRFDFPNEDILFIRDYKVPGPDKGPEPGLRWRLVLDGVSNAQCHMIWAILISPKGFHLRFTARLCFDYTNNMEEYEACIFRIKSAIDLRIKIFEVYEDSTLVTSQIKGEWEIRHRMLIPYKKHVLKLIPYFDEITFHPIPRKENQLTDALATLSSMFRVKLANEAPSIKIEYLDEPTYYLATMVTDCFH